MTTFQKQSKRLVERFNPCSEAREWLDNGFKTPQQAWDECKRGDWMLWLLGRLSGKVGSKSRKKLVKACCACARLVLPIYEKKYPADNRVRNCIDITEAYPNGNATLEEVSKARYAAEAAAYTADAAHAAAYAAEAAACAAYAACAAEPAYALKQCADEVRKLYPKVPKL